MSSTPRRPRPSSRAPLALGLALGLSLVAAWDTAAAGLDRPPLEVAQVDVHDVTLPEPQTSEPPEAPPPEPPPEPRGLTERTLTLGEAKAQIWEAGRHAHFKTPSDGERAALATLVVDLLEAVTWPEVDLTEHDRAAREHDLAVELWRVQGQPFVALVEAPGRDRGAGAYLFRPGPRRAREVLLQAPHAYHDLWTGHIAAYMFFEAEGEDAPRALFTNTAHRFAATGGKRAKRSGSDACHAPAHNLSAATEAALTALRHVDVVQLHGFDEGRPRRADGSAVAPVEVIVSAGEAAGSTPRSGAVATWLKGVFGDEAVARYPEDVRALGATRNLQSHLVQEVAEATFVHVELGAAVRERLRKSAETRAAFVGALVGAPAAAAQAPPEPPPPEPLPIEAPPRPTPPQVAAPEPPPAEASLPEAPSPALAPTEPPAEVSTTEPPPTEPPPTEPPPTEPPPAVEAAD